MDEKEDWFEKCRTCQHCYSKNNDDYYYCRKRNGKCEYKPYATSQSRQQFMNRFMRKD